MRSSLLAVLVALTASCTSFETEFQHVESYDWSHPKTWSWLSPDDGGLPLYVAVVWVGLIAAYLIVMFTLALPDLQAWSQP